MVTDEIAIKHGFKNDSLTPYLWSFQSSDMMCRLHALVKVTWGDGEDEPYFVFRKVGSTVGKVESEEHLVELIKKHRLVK